MTSANTDVSGSKLQDTLMVILMEFFEKDDFEKKTADDKTLQNQPVGNDIKSLKM